MSNVRTRFAPSPTGLLHVGGIRTALFAWLVAKQAKGQFILRLEDTDQKRELPGAAQHIVESLKALGLDFDEGPIRQSERLNVYKEWAEKLMAAGRAYADPYTPEEVQAFREEAQKDKRPFLYRDHRPENPPKWDGSLPLRFKSEPTAYKWHDEVMSDLSTGSEVIDDFVLIKSDGFPTYNFSHIVDDAEMKISHVIRGQEFLASMPNYLNLYEALGIEKPIFATMPHILNPEGNKKLSKRDGAKDVLDYVRDGFLPEALLSFIASLGWNDGTKQEIFSVAELIKKFSLDRVQRSGARFDEHRLLWVNGHFLRELSLDELQKKAEPFWPAEASKYDVSYKRAVLGLIQERLKFLGEITELTPFFFKDLPVNASLIKEHKQLKSVDTSQLKQWLEQTAKELNNSTFAAEDLQQRLNELLQQSRQKPVIFFSLIRIATTQAESSPSLAETLSVLGKEVTLRRLKQQIDAL